MQIRAGYICCMEWQFTLKEIAGVAAQFWQAAGRKRVFALHGSMGAGKTTLVHALCDSLKVSSPVGSPTYSLINEYHYPGGILYHIDLYRLNSEEEVMRAGVEDCLYSGHICLVEWPEKAFRILPSDSVHVYIEVMDEQARRLHMVVE